MKGSNQTVNESFRVKYLSLFMNFAENFEEQPVLGHGVHTTRQREQGTEQSGRHSGQGSDGYDNPRPGDSVSGESIRKGRCRVDGRVRHHQSQGRADADVADGHQAHRDESGHRNRKAWITRFLAGCRNTAD